ncbi:MAG: leucine-rich repeat domain-containing protein [Clostridia bacterium]|nr:leucine-rich repeat domain-containing protein [Clostridia bacterium]
MKKFKTPLTMILATITVVLLAIVTSACSGNVLPTPDGVEIDLDTYRLSWNAIAEARSYEVEIVNLDDLTTTVAEPKKSNYSLVDLSFGDYSLKVRAMNAVTNARSDWSKTIYFHKDYETGCVYTLINNDTEFEVTKAGRGESTKGAVVLEDNYRGIPVTRIADGAFRGKTGAVSGVTSIVVGGNVTYIGDGAFNGCGVLTEIYMPDGVTYLGVGAFNRCLLLESVTIPKGVSEISDSLFINCTSLKEVVLHDGITSIGEAAFFKCAALEEFTVPDSVLIVGESAFASSGLKKVTLGSGMTSVSHGTFDKCERLTEVTFSDAGNLVSLDKYAFADCVSLTRIKLPENLKSIEYGCFYDDTSLEEIILPDSVEHIGSGAFIGAKFYTDQIAASNTFIYADDWLVYVTPEVKNSLEKINHDTVGLKDNVIGIADSVFESAEKLKEVVFPSSLKYIGKNAFGKCSVLWKVDTVNVTKIGEYAFAECVTLSNPILGKKLKTIGSYAFFRCKMLENTEWQGNSIIPDSVESIGTYAFYGTKLWNSPDDRGVVYAGNWVVGYNYDARNVTVSAEITLNNDVRGVSDYAFFENEIIMNVIGLNRARYIGRGAFYGCTNLSVVALNRNLKKIEDYTFYKCGSLFRVSFPPYLESIGRSAFYKCARLSSVDLSSSMVETIGPYAFYECANLTGVEFGEDLTEIGEYAFYKCENLTTADDGVLTFTDSVKTIGGRAFANITSIKTIDFGDSLEEIGGYAFSGCTSLKSIELPDSVVTVKNNAFYNCSAVEKIDLGNGVKNIEKYAFFGLEKVGSITIPSSLKSVGPFAFKGMVKIKTLFIPSTLETIDDHAFYGLRNVTFYTDAEALPGGWSVRWNSSYRPVVWGATLSEEGYVYSVTICKLGVQDNHAKSGVGDPVRKGRTFVGWSTEENSSVAQYSTAELSSLKEGTTVYSVWE